MDSEDQKTMMTNAGAGSAAINRRETDEAAAPPGHQPRPIANRPLPRSAPKVSRGPALVVALIVAAIVGLSLWYLVQPQPLIIQGEADATRIDIAARVDGRVAEAPG